MGGYFDQFYLDDLYIYELKNKKIRLLLDRFTIKSDLLSGGSPCHRYIEGKELHINKRRYSTDYPSILFRGEEKKHKVNPQGNHMCDTVLFKKENLSVTLKYITGIYQTLPISKVIIDNDIYKNIYQISKKTNISVQKIIDENPLIDIYNLKSGDIIKLPTARK